MKLGILLFFIAIIQLLPNVLCTQLPNNPPASPISNQENSADNVNIQMSESVTIAENESKDDAQAISNVNITTERVDESHLFNSHQNNTEKSILQFNLINFHSKVSKKIFNGLLGDVTTLYPQNGSSLTNIYEREGDSHFLLSVKEDQYQLNHYDVVLVYVDTSTLMNEDYLLRVLLQSIQTLKLKQEEVDHLSDSDAKSRSKPVLKIVFNGAKESVKRLLAGLNEAFFSSADFYAKEAEVIDDLSSSSKKNTFSFKKISKPEEIQLSNNVREPYLRKVSEDATAMAEQIDYEILYLPIPKPLEQQETIPLYATVIEKIIEASENNTIPYHLFLQQEQVLAPSKASRRIRTTPTVTTKTVETISQLSDTTECIQRLKRYQQQALQQLLQIVNQPHMIEKLNVNYIHFQSLRSFGKLIDSFLDELFQYYHQELIGKDVLLMQYLGHLPWLSSRDNSNNYYRDSSNHKRDPAAAAIQQAYTFQTYELFATTIQRFIPFYNKQLELLIQSKEKRYQKAIAENEIEVSLDFASDLETKRQEMLSECQREAWSLLPPKYYHRLFQSQASWLSSLSLPSLKLLLPFLKPTPSVRSRLLVKRPVAAVVGVIENTLDESIDFLHSPYLTQSSYPLIQSWNYPELSRLLQEKLSEMNHRIITYYKSTKTLPAGRKSIVLSFHWLIHYPLNLRDYHQDPLLLDRQRDSLVYYDSNCIGVTDTSNSHSHSQSDQSQQKKKRRGSSSSDHLLSVVSPSARQAREWLQQQLTATKGDRTNHQKGWLQRRSEFAREMVMFPLSVKPIHLPFSSKSPRRRGSGRPKLDPHRAKNGPERFIRWDIPPLDEVKENLELLEKERPPLSLLDRILNLIPAVGRNYVPPSLLSYGEAYDPPVANERFEEEEAARFTEETLNHREGADNEEVEDSLAGEGEEEENEEGAEAESS